MKNLKNLTVNELKEVIEEASFLLSVQSGTSSNMEIFYYSIVRCLNKYSITSPPFGTFKKQNYYKKFIDVFNNIESFIDKNFKKVSKVERSKLYSFFTDTIISHIKNNTNLQPSIRILINYFQYLPQLIDKSFPGYIENEILNILLEKI